MVKKKELKKLTAEEREKQLREIEMSLMKANSQVASGGAPKNPGQIRHMKKTIARILTYNKLATKEETQKNG